MKKLLFLTIVSNLFALGSEQPKSILSNLESAQLVANFTKLPEEIKCMVFPEYCPELNALVSLKKIPEYSEQEPCACGGEPYSWSQHKNYWRDFLSNPAKKRFSKNYIFWIKQVKIEYPVYSSEIICKCYYGYIPPTNIKGPNKNNVVLLDNNLIDLNTIKLSQYKLNSFEKLYHSCCSKFFNSFLYNPFIFGFENWNLSYLEIVKRVTRKKILKKFKFLQNTSDRKEDKISGQAVYLDEKYPYDQSYLCLHPTKNIIISKDLCANTESYKKNNHARFVTPDICPQVTITFYDSATNKHDIQSIDVKNPVVNCAFDASELSKDTFWAIDTNQKLLRFTKKNSTYEPEEFNLSHDVMSIHQLRDNPNLVLLNSNRSSYLYQIQDDRKLKLLKAFEAPATFLQKDDNLSVREKYQQDHVVVVKPLTAVNGFVQKQSAKALVDKLSKLLAAKTNLKQRILQSFQSGKDIK